jgi:hypothetical protein
MDTMDEIAEFKAVVSKRVAEFGIPDWIEQECPLCKGKVETKDIMGMEVHFVPMFLWDVGFIFFCPNCNASFAKHLKCDAHNLQEIANAFAGEKRELIGRDKLFAKNVHNLVGI